MMDGATGLESGRDTERRAAALSRIEKSGPTGACLAVLLRAVEWAGSPRRLMEAIPHAKALETTDELRIVLNRLGYSTHGRSLRLRDIGDSMLPCIRSDGSRGGLSVLLRRSGKSQLVEFRASTGREHKVDTRGTSQFFLIEPTDPEETREVVRRMGWMQFVISRFRRSITTIMLLSLVVNLLSLAVPIFVMAVYDRAISASSVMTLVSLLAAVMLALLLEGAFRTARSRAVAFLGARIESLVTTGAFGQILGLPLMMTEPAPIPAQLSRLRQFSGIRSVFVGQLGTALIDLPFVAIFLAAIFAIGGPLGFAPLGLLVFFLLIAAVTVPLSRRRVRFSGDASARARAFLMELVQKHGTIRDNRAETVWLGRASDLIGRSLHEQFRAQQMNLVLLTGSQTLVMVTGVVTVALGVMMALEGTLSIGALIAVIALIWRLLSPVQAIFLGLNQIGQAIDTVNQLNRLMQIKTEPAGEFGTNVQSYRGRVTLDEVSMRHSPDADLALKGISLDIPAGQTVAITGPSGGGKSTLLKIVAGLVQPQAGAVRIDDLDLRQIDPATHRATIGYIPGEQTVFYGTIAQNLQLGRPDATAEEMETALEMAGAGELLRSLPDGLDTRIRAVDAALWSDGRLQRLSLARAFVRRSSLYLMDDPGSRLDQAGEAALRAAIWKLSGEATVLLVTHRPSLMRLTDRVLVMAGGRITADGEPDKIVPVLLDRLAEQKSHLEPSEERLPEY